MGTKYKYDGDQVLRYFANRTLKAKIETLENALGRMEYKKPDTTIADCIAEAMNFWKEPNRPEGHERYILEDYAREYPENTITHPVDVDVLVQNFIAEQDKGRFYSTVELLPLCQQLGRKIYKAL